MRISSLYRKVLRLVAGCTLIVTGLSVVGCSMIQKPMSYAEKVEHYPSIALSVDSHDYEFNWDTIEINGVPLRKILPQGKFWRVAVFQFSDGTRIGGNDSDFRSFENEEQMKETLKNLPFNKLLRADIDLKNNPNAKDLDEDAKTVSFMVLLHDE